MALTANTGLSWRLKIQDPEHGECRSSTMTKDRAVAFAQDLLGGAVAIGMESDAGEVLDADALQALIAATPRRSRPR